MTGYIWWVGYDKNVYFVDPATATAAPEQITDALKNHQNMSIEVDSTQVRNDITILGGTAESSSYAQVILGDANAREWVLLYPVTTMTSIELDTGGGYVVKAFGTDPTDTETGYDFMYSPTRGSIRATATTTTPGATNKIRVTYTYPKQVITEVQSPTSIATMKALEGGDGVHGYTIQDSTIVSNDQAQQRALRELDAFSVPILSGQFTTRTGLLTAGSYFSPGQLLTVNLPSWGISSNTTYIIQKVVTSLNESGSAIEYTYDVTFGGRLLGVLDFLQALATPEQPLDISGQVQKVNAVAESMTLSESVASSQTTPTPTANSKSVDLQASTQYIDFGDNLTDSLSAMTLEFWIKLDTFPSASQNFYLLQKWNGAANQASFILDILNTSGVQKLECYIANSLSDPGNNSGKVNALTTTATPAHWATGTWFHVVVVFDGSGATNADRLKIYFATQSAGHQLQVIDYFGTIPSALTNSTTSLRFGEATGASMDGRIDDIRIWNIPKTIAQLDNGYKVELVDTNPGLIGYWKCNDGSGATVAATIGGFNGTITNGTPTWSSEIPFS